MKKTNNPVRVHFRLHPTATTGAVTFEFSYLKFEIPEYLKSHKASMASDIKYHYRYKHNAFHM